MVVEKTIVVSDDLMDEGFDEGWWTAVLADEEAYQDVDGWDGDFEAQQSTFEVDWGIVDAAYHEDEIIQLTVYGYNRGGVLVQTVGMHGFVPVSHLVDLPANLNEEDRRNRLADYVGRSLDLKILEFDPAHERVVLSERAAQSGEGCRRTLFEAMEPGTLAHGVVTNVTDFGAFVDLGGVEGLIHVSEMSWGRVQHPTDILSVGDSVDVLVMTVNEENGRIALSLKRLHPNPWDLLVTRYRPGDVVVAIITSVTRYGIFARLDEGVEGLIHVSSMRNHELDMKNGKHFQPGDRIQVRIIHIDSIRRRLGLGLAIIE